MYSTSFSLERVGIDGEAVVLRGDLDAAGAEVFDRMVAAAVAELELVGLAAEGQAEELVAEADAEDRDLADEMADVVLRVRHRLRIAGAVREQHAVVAAVEDLLGMRGRRIDRDLAALPHELPQDVALHAEVVHGHAQPRCGGVLVERIRTQRRDALHQIETGHRRRRRSSATIESTERCRRS